jgi:hypothetical protein
MLRRWLLANPDENGRRWAYPQNVVMIDNTVVGVVLNMCHGAGALVERSICRSTTAKRVLSGIKTKTMADIVYGMEYVDCDGNLVSITEDDIDPHTMRALAGSFGVLGVVVSVTLKLIPMVYTDLYMEKVSMFSAVPPRDLNDIPVSMREFIDIDMSESALAEVSACVVRMNVHTDLAIDTQQTRAWEQQITSDFFCEIFWFPWNSQHLSYVVRFGTTEEPEGAEEVFPSELQMLISKTQAIVADDTLNKVSFIDTLTQAKIFSTFAMLTLPEFKHLKTPIINAIHYRSGINIFRVKSFEVELCIPRKASSNDLDLSVVQRAWWDAIKVFDRYAEEKKLCPANVALEIRVTGGSDCCLAAQRGNEATCSLEVLSSLPLSDEQAHQLMDFNSDVFAVWSSYSDDCGNPLPCRPHWAKDWANVK